MADRPMDMGKDELADHVMLHGDDAYCSDMSLDTLQRDPSIFSDDSVPASPTVRYSFFTLPAELRELVYAELLVSDSAFRLGHHGPYSHEERRKLHPQILRVNRTVYEEASRVLYGDNTFFLGPIGHKPTYSASFCASIGHHNTLKIRTLVAHCTYPARLSLCCLQNWVGGFGLDLDRVKTLAVSFAAEGADPLSGRGAHGGGRGGGGDADDDADDRADDAAAAAAAVQQLAAAPSAGIVVFATPLNPHYQHAPFGANGLPTMPSPGPGFVPLPMGFVPPGIPLASSPADDDGDDFDGAGAPARPLPPFFQTVFNPLMLGPLPTMPTHLGPVQPGQYPTHVATIPLQQLGLAQPATAPPAAVVAAAAAARLERRRDERRRAAAAAEREVAAMCARVAPWLARAPRREVERWAAVRNTDLRAGRWLLHVSPATRKRSGLKY